MVAVSEQMAYGDVDTEVEEECRKGFGKKGDLREHGFAPKEPID